MQVKAVKGMWYIHWGRCTRQRLQLQLQKAECWGRDTIGSPGKKQPCARNSQELREKGNAFFRFLAASFMWLTTSISSCLFFWDVWGSGHFCTLGHLNILDLGRGWCSLESCSCLRRGKNLAFRRHGFAVIPPSIWCFRFVLLWSIQAIRANPSDARCLVLRSDFDFGYHMFFWSFLIIYNIVIYTVVICDDYCILLYHSSSAGSLYGCCRTQQLHVLMAIRCKRQRLGQSRRSWPSDIRWC